MTQEEYPQPADLDSPISTLLLWTRKITDAHLIQRGKKGEGKWSDDAQIARMHEEVSEVYRVIRKGEGKERRIHECLDVIFAALTAIVLDEDITYGDVGTELQVVCKKLEDRYFNDE